LSTAVNKTGNPEEFTQRYQGLLKHYGLEGRKIQASKPHENGDVEQRHHRFKRAVDQALMLRGSRDFAGRGEYETFLKNLFLQLNAGRRGRFLEEQDVFRRLPRQKMESCRRIGMKVGKSSTIRVAKNVYSVHSRLIGEEINVRLYAEHLEVWSGQHLIETIPRLRGESRHRINYRHIIDWLVRKPGAFENYRYRDDLFPGHRFRLAYDALKKSHPARAHKEYLKILYLAARENESAVDDALRYLIDAGRTITATVVEVIVNSKLKPASPTTVCVAPVNLAAYDSLLHLGEATC
jgi:hypothetical protein